MALKSEMVNEGLLIEAGLTDEGMSLELKIVD